MFFLVLLFWTNVLATVVPPVSFFVKNKEYIEICAGEPCQPLTFRLNRTSNEVWLHRASYIYTSKTYYQSQSGRKDSEVFYFTAEGGNIKVSLKVVYTPQNIGLLSKDAPVIDGTFGLGPKSELWSVWGNYTLSTQRLDIGRYNRYGQRDFRQNPPVLFLNGTQNITLGDGSRVKLEFDLTTPQTLIPYGMDLEKVFDTVVIHSSQCSEYYKSMKFENVEHCINDVTINPDQFQTITLLNGVDYEAMDYTSENSVILGSRFVEDLFWFRDIHGGVLIITEDAFFMNHTSLAITASIVLSVLLVFWCSIAESKQDRTDGFEFTFMMAIEFFCYIGGWIVLIVDFSMLDWSRYITVYSNTSSWFAVTYLLTVIISSFVIFIYSFAHYKNHFQYIKDFKTNGMFRAAFFISSQLIIIWLCLVHKHEIVLDRFLLTLLVDLALIFQLTALSLCFIQAQWLYILPLLLLTGSTFAFNIIYNLLPFFRFESIRVPLDVLCIVWCLSVDLVPAFFITTILKMNQAVNKKK